MIYTIGKVPTMILWQEPKEAVVGEPALALLQYTDTLVIKQGSKEINVSMECVPELIKALKMIQVPHD